MFCGNSFFLNNYQGRITKSNKLVTRAYLYRPETSRRQLWHASMPPWSLPWCPWNAPVQNIQFPHTWYPLPRSKYRCPSPFKNKAYSPEVFKNRFSVPGLFEVQPQSYLEFWFVSLCISHQEKLYQYLARFLDHGLRLQFLFWEGSSTRIIDVLTRDCC